MSVLVSGAELGGLIARGCAPAVLDVRWRLDKPDGRGDYEAGHIPGAVYASLEDDLADHSRVGLGRHPLPDGRRLEAAARGWGLRRGQPVVVYDDWNRAGSSRAWWVLTAAGIPDVRILDGGLSAWLAAGGAVETGPREPGAGDVAVDHHDLYRGARPALTAEQLAGVATLLDARAPARFRGEDEPVDPVAGHIPGAINLPSLAVLAADGTFLPGGQLVELLERVGVDPASEIGVYCGSGVTASVVLAALSLAGWDAALFPGSWSQWCAQGRPAARGPA